jgi:hypothetical protein
LPEPVRAEVQVRSRGLQAAMAEQRLEREQIDAGFEQVGRVAVPRRVHRAVFARAAFLDQTAKATLHVAGGDRSVRLVARGKPGAWPAQAPAGAELLEQTQRQRHQPILGALALAHVDHPAGAVEVADLQVQQFAQTQAAAVGDLREDAVASG